MKWWAGIIWMVCVGCGPKEAAEKTSFPATRAVCEGSVGLPALSQNPRVSGIGEASNVLLPHDGRLWVVESFQNTISRFDPATGVMESGFVDLGNDRNPYDLAIEGGQGWVTNLLAHSVSVFDPKNGRLIKEITHPDLKSPSGIALTQNHAFVSSVDFARGPELGEGSVAVFDRRNFVHLGTIATAAKNPQFLTSYKDAEGRWGLIVVSTGALGLDERGAYVPRSAGGIEVWGVDQGVPGEDARRRWPIPLSSKDPRWGGAGRAHVGGGRAVMTSATGPVAYSFDLAQGVWLRGPENPWVLYDTRDATESTLHHSFLDAGGLLWVTSFNQDALYVWDTSCGAMVAGPLGLGVDPERLEGPHGVALLPQWPGRIYYIMERANLLGELVPRP